MFSLTKNISKITCKNSNLRFVSSIFINKNSTQVARKNTRFIADKISPYILHGQLNEVCGVTCKLNASIETKRYFSKKKGSKRTVEEEEESDSEVEEEYQEDVNDLGDNVISKTVSSIRIDSILKAGLGITKKKIEQEFYAFNLRVNGQKVMKKAMNVYVGDEIDRVRGFSPDTDKYILVDRVILKGIGSITGNGNYPVKLEVLKQLPIENYEEPWSPSNFGG